MDSTLFGTLGEIFGRFDQWSFWQRMLVLGVMFLSFTIARYFVATHVTKSPMNGLKANGVTFLILFVCVAVIGGILSMSGPQT